MFKAEEEQAVQEAPGVPPGGTAATRGMVARPQVPVTEGTADAGVTVASVPEAATGELAATAPTSRSYTDNNRSGYR
jgi:hypothetical protein